MFDLSSRIQRGRTKTKFQKQSVSQLQQLSLDQVQFSTQQIIFINSGSPNVRYLSNTQLKIVNAGNLSICYKIKCTSPQKYHVYPFQGQIQQMKSCQINIRLLLSDGCDWNKVKNDRFQIKYGIKPEFANKNVQYIMSKKISVRVVFYSRQEDQKSAQIQVKSLKQQNLYEELLRKNQAQIQQVSQSILKIQSDKKTNNFLSKQFLFCIGIIGFVIGYYFS